MKNYFVNHKRIAMASALTICLTVISTFTLAKRSDAFTLIELQLAPSPVTLTGDQSARFLVNNTFGNQEVRVTIDWGDGVTGASLGQTFTGDVLPGHGIVAIFLPAVQSPAAAVATHTVIARLKLSPSPGSAGLPADAAKRIRASLEVRDAASPKTVLAYGLATAPTAVE